MSGPGRIRRGPLALLLLAPLFLAGCGRSGAPGREVSRKPGPTPRATFQAMRAATLDRNWDELYELIAPSERSAAEAAWKVARTKPDRVGILSSIAREIRTSPDEIAELSVRQIFKARSEAQVAREHSPTLAIAQNAVFLRTEPVDGDARTVHFRSKEEEAVVPMVRENGLWYLSGPLKTFTDLAR